MIFLLSITTLLSTGGSFGCNSHGNVNDTDNFRPDVFQCENAVAHVEQCCPSFDAPPPNVCLHRYVTSHEDCGCGGSRDHEEHIEPVWDESRSEAVTSLSCEELQAENGCQALAEELAKNNSKITDSDSCSDSNNNSHELD